MVYPIGKLLRPLVTFPVKEVKGLENLPNNISFVIASNHNSFIDALVIVVPVIGYLQKKRIYFISTMFFFFDFMLNLLFSEFGGSIKLKRNVRESFLKPALKQLKKGNIICIFPEGLPNKRSNIRRGKLGVAKLVLKGKVPVVPIGIKGTLYIWSRLKWLPRPKKKIIINIGKPIYFDKYYKQAGNRKILEKVTREIMKNIASLCGKRYIY